MLDIQDTMIFYGECNKHHQFGTAFTLHKNLISSVREFKSIKPRISVLTITYSTEEKTQEEDKFYDNSEHTINEIPQSRIRIVLGDLNAKLGKEKILRSTIGNHSLHNVTSKNGLRLIDFASGGGLVVKSTIFPHKNIYKGTRKAPNDRYLSQIDYVLINTRFKNCVHNINTVR